MSQQTNKSSFFRELDRIIEEYKITDYNQFNWFKVMYKMTEEKNLHSRFIAFLLNPRGSHGQGDVFLKLFLEDFNILNFNLEGIIVLPDEDTKKEEDNIDILIKNSSKQAIIIENKIFASDSNKEEVLEDEKGTCTHKYQIPRYYKKATCNGRLTVTNIIYLNVKDIQPSFYDEFPSEVKEILQCRNYIKDVLAWIGKCIDVCSEENIFKVGLIQYKQATTEFLNDYKLALDLQEVSSLKENLEEAFTFWDTGDEDTKYRVIKKQFKHVKWHTVYDFYSELKEALETKYKERVQVNEVDKEQITKLTHTGSDKEREQVNEVDKKQITKLTNTGSNRKTVLTFSVDNEPYYVCNDGKGFSVGRNKKNKTKGEDYEAIYEKKEYKYFDFSQRDVFELVISAKRKEIIDKILEVLTEKLIKC